MKRKAILLCMALSISNIGYAASQTFHAVSSAACGVGALYSFVHSSGLANQAAAMAGQVAQEAAANLQRSNSRQSWPVDTGNLSNIFLVNLLLAPFALLNAFDELSRTPEADKMNALRSSSNLYMWGGIGLACGAAYFGYRAIALANKRAVDKSLLANEQIKDCDVPVKS